MSEPKGSGPYSLGQTEKKQSLANKCINERRRRDQENYYFEELAEIISASIADMSSSFSVKPEKCAILQETVKQIKQLKQGTTSIGDTAVQQSQVSSSKPNILTDDFLGPLLLEALDGFLFVVNCQGKVEFVSENVTHFLKYTQDDLIGKSVYNIIHVGDHAQFSNSLLPMSVSSINWSENLSGKGKTFNCRLLIKPPLDDDDLEAKQTYVSQYETMQISSSLHPDYFSDNVETSDSNNPSLVCVARRLPLAEKTKAMLGVEQFTTKQDLNGKIIGCDISGIAPGRFHQHDFVGQKIQDFCHANDVQQIAKHLQEVINIGHNTSAVYRFKLQEKRFVFVQTKSNLFQNRVNGNAEFIMSVHSIIRECDTEDEKGSASTSLMKAIIGPSINQNNQSKVSTVAISSVNTSIANMALVGNAMLSQINSGNFQGLNNNLSEELLRETNAWDTQLSDSDMSRFEKENNNINFNFQNTSITSTSFSSSSWTNSNVSNLDLSKMQQLQRSLSTSTSTQNPTSAAIAATMAAVVSKRPASLSQYPQRSSSLDHGQGQSMGQGQRSPGFTQNPGSRSGGFQLPSQRGPPSFNRRSPAASPNPHGQGGFNLPFSRTPSPMMSPSPGWGNQSIMSPSLHSSQQSGFDNQSVQERLFQQINGLDGLVGGDKKVNRSTKLCQLLTQHSPPTSSQKSTSGTPKSARSRHNSRQSIMEMSPADSRQSPQPGPGQSPPEKPQSTSNDDGEHVVQTESKDANRLLKTLLSQTDEEYEEPNAGKKEESGEAQAKQKENSSVEMEKNEAEAKKPNNILLKTLLSTDDDAYFKEAKKEGLNQMIENSSVIPKLMKDSKDNCRSAPAESTSADSELRQRHRSEPQEPQSTTSHLQPMPPLSSPLTSPTASSFNQSHTGVDTSLLKGLFSGNTSINHQFSGSNSLFSGGNITFVNHSGNTSNSVRSGGNMGTLANLSGNTSNSLNTGNTSNSLNTGNTSNSLNTGNISNSLNTGNTGNSLNTGNINNSLNTGNINNSLNTGNINNSLNTGNINNSLPSGNMNSSLPSGNISNSLHSGGMSNSINTSGNISNSLNSGGNMSNSFNSGGNMSTFVSRSGNVSKSLHSGGNIITSLHSGNMRTNLHSGGNTNTSLHSGGNTNTSLHSGGNTNTSLHSGGNMSSVMNSSARLSNTVNSSAQITNSVNSNMHVSNILNSVNSGNSSITSRLLSVTSSSDMEISSNSKDKSIDKLLHILWEDGNSEERESVKTHLNNLKRKHDLMEAVSESENIASQIGGTTGSTAATNASRLSRENALLSQLLSKRSSDEVEFVVSTRSIQPSGVPQARYPPNLASKLLKVNPSSASVSAPDSNKRQKTSEGGSSGSTLERALTSSSSQKLESAVRSSSPVDPSSSRFSQDSNSGFSNISSDISSSQFKEQYSELQNMLQSVSDSRSVATELDPNDNTDHVLAQILQQADDLEREFSIQSISGSNNTQANQSSQKLSRDSGNSLVSAQNSGSVQGMGGSGNFIQNSVSGSSSNLATRSTPPEDIMQQLELYESIDIDSLLGGGNSLTGANNISTLDMNDQLAIDAIQKQLMTEWPGQNISGNLAANGPTPQHLQNNISRQRFMQQASLTEQHGPMAGPQMQQQQTGMLGNQPTQLSGMNGQFSQNTIRQALSSQVRALQQPGFVPNPQSQNFPGQGPRLPHPQGPLGSALPSPTQRPMFTNSNPNSTAMQVRQSLLQQQKMKQLRERDKQRIHQQDMQKILLQQQQQQQQQRSFGGQQFPGQRFNQENLALNSGGGIVQFPENLAELMNSVSAPNVTLQRNQIPGPMSPRFAQGIQQPPQSPNMGSLMPPSSQISPKFSPTQQQQQQQQWNLRQGQANIGLTNQTQAQYNRHRSLSGGTMPTNPQRFAFSDSSQFPGNQSMAGMFTSQQQQQMFQQNRGSQIQRQMSMPGRGSPRASQSPFGPNSDPLLMSPHNVSPNSMRGASGQQQISPPYSQQGGMTNNYGQVSMASPSSSMTSPQYSQQNQRLMDIDLSLFDNSKKPLDVPLSVNTPTSTHYIKREIRNLCNARTSERQLQAQMMPPQQSPQFVHHQQQQQHQPMDQESSELPLDILEQINEMSQEHNNSLPPPQKQDFKEELVVPKKRIEAKSRYETLQALASSSDQDEKAANLFRKQLTAQQKLRMAATSAEKVPPSYVEPKHVNVVQNEPRVPVEEIKPANQKDSLLQQLLSD